MNIYIYSWNEPYDTRRITNVIPTEPSVTITWTPSSGSGMGCCRSASPTPHLAEAPQREE